MSNNKVTPEIRFKDFNDPWEQRKASELFKSVSDKKHPNLPVLSASQEKGMILRDDIGIDIKYDHKSLSNYKRVTPGQFVIHLRSFQGGFADSQMEGITSPAYTVIDFKEKDQNHSLFWKEILTSQSFIKRLETVTYGIRDGRSISFSDFSTLKFLVPKLDEQEKIAVLFKTLDQTITLHQHELTLLKQRKKAFLQKMFPKKEERTPDVRFSGFYYNWNNRVLGELVDISTGKLDANAMKENGEYDFYTSGIKKFKIDTFSFEGPAITIAGNGAKVGYMHYADGKFNAYQRTYVLTNFRSIREFIYLEIERKLPRKIKKEARTGNIPYIVREMLTNLEIQIPAIEEQEEIGNFFKQLDEDIELHEQKTKTLKQMKKAFLQKMFV